MSKSIVSVCLLRILYPLCMTLCVTCRQDLITAVFLMFLLYVPFVPLPTPNTMGGATGFFLKLSFAMSVVMLTLQVAFQVVLLSMGGTYGSIIYDSCSHLERLFRHIGFIRYDGLLPGDVISHVAPEVIALFTSFFVYVLCDHLNPRNGDTHAAEQGILLTLMQPTEGVANVRQSQMKKKAVIALTIIGKYLSLIMLCFTSILVPSITSGLLYAVFLCCITYWACCKDLGRGFAVLTRFLCAVIFVYVTAIFCYQTEMAQELLTPDGKIPRWFGLQALRLTNCTTDSRLFIVNQNLLWQSFVLPFALIALYNLLIFESRILFVVSAVKRAFIEDSERLYSPNEATPLIRGRESIYRKSGNSTVSQDSRGSVTVTNTVDPSSSKPIEELPEGEESLKVDILEYLIDAFITVVSFITRTSYIGTNIIMMTWSITYHSWLTFVLLLGAIILWMVPNQRQSMLRVSPFLVMYAEFLLISQYVGGGLDIKKSELPPINIKLPEDLFDIPNEYAFSPLAIKSLFTTMFWITMRQYMRERKESRSTSTVAHIMTQAHHTVGTVAAMGGDPASKGGQIIQKFGERLRLLMIKFWIWVVTITLFAIGITGQEMSLVRIIYTALALIFVIVFQLSWTLWRKMMYGFWLTVIVISMIILVMIYTFQFNTVKDAWEYIGVNDEWQKYIGLEKKNTGELFFFLIIPTFFVIITVIQLKYFHKDFLQMSDIKSRGTSTNRPKSRPSIMSDDEYGTPTEEMSSKAEEGPSHAEDAPSPQSSRTLVDDENQIDVQQSRPSFHLFGHTPTVKTLQKIDLISFYLEQSTEFFWLFMELHVKKLVLLLIVVVSLSRVSVIHFGFILGSTLAMMLNSKFQDIVIRLMSLSAAVVLLAEMIFQIEHFDVGNWSTNCSKPANLSSNVSVEVQLNGTDWLGFYKADETKPMVSLLAGYIWIIVAVTFYVVVITKQKYVRHLRGRPLCRSRVLFPRISCKDVDRDLISCVKYLFNFGFYRFGVEITFIFLVILIGFRLDFVALVYGVWLLMMIGFSRPTLSRVWYTLNWFVAITILLQYAIIVGPPPQFCFAPFDFSTSKSYVLWLQWLFLPVYDKKPNITKLFWDFLVLLLVTRQTKVFRIEWQHASDEEYPGGSNKSILNEVESPNYVNPTPDFISDKNSYVDILKHGLFCSLLWISCAVIFVAGTTNVTIFSFVYVISSFLILWQGNDFYLRPVGTILKTWNRILGYNVFVIVFKVLLQIPGCIYYHEVSSYACWLAQLLGIMCMNSFSLASLSTKSIPITMRGCSADSIMSGGLGVDAVCFICLIMQKRLLSSHYFVRIVDDAKAMAVLAARGAELIEELSKKQIQKQQELEKTVLQKIKSKMDSIKAAQQKIQGHKVKEITSHYEERQAPLARDTSPSISSAVSHQGFHTPLEDDPPTNASRPSSYLQPPTPTSAIMTVSLEGYLDPQRISCGSPPTSHRPFSFDDSFQQPFSSPPPRRRSSLGYLGAAHWYQSAPITMPAPRRSLSISSHHTSIRSGDYYMFDDYDTAPVLIPEDELDAVDELEEEYQGKTVSKLMETVLKTDMKRALKSKSSDDSKSTTSKSKRSGTPSKTSISTTDVEDGEDDDDKDCSTCQFKSTDATTSKDVTDSLDDSSVSLRRIKRSSYPKRTSFKHEKREKRSATAGAGDDDPSDHSDGHSTDSDQSTLVSSDSDDIPLAKCFDSFVTYLKFAFAFINSLMVSMTLFLNRKSKDYRYVIQALEKEKKHLKETRNLRVGMRIPPEMKWRPTQAGSVLHRSKSPMKMEEFESAGLVASTQPVFIRLLLAIYHAIMSHSDLVCYVAVFMLQIRNPTLASLPLTLMVFFWGSLSIPRPTKRFWVTIIAYTEFVIVIKSMCQSEVFPIERPTDDKPFHWQRILGIEKDPNSGLYDLILLLAVFFHRSTLKSLGLWKSAEECQKDNLANLNYAEPRRNSPTSDSASEGVTEVTTVNLVLPEQGPSDELAGQSTDSYQNPTVPQMKLNSRSLSASDENVSNPFFKSVHDFFNKLLNSKNRIADDVYAYMFICDFCNFIVIIFGYSSFGASRGEGGVAQYIESNKIPIAFLLMVILQFALIVVDRWLYLRRYIFGKLMFQYGLVIGIHIWMFFILPAVTERQFDEALPPSIWYFIKCIYLLLSAYQIRSGYPSRILGNFLCKNYNIVNMVLFKCFMYTPFVYELRTLMDWMWTQTSMTLADWIKMEDIFAQIFLLKCARRSEGKYLLPRGQKIAAKTKIIYGGGGLIALFTIIWFPLVLFALGDTVGEPNRPTDMDAKVQISSYQAIYMGSTSKIYGLNEWQFERLKEIYKSNGRAQTFLSDYNPEDVGVVFMPHYSSSIWTIPTPEEADLIRELKNKTLCSTLKVTMEWTLNRESQNPEVPKTVSGTNTIGLTEDICNMTAKLLESSKNESGIVVNNNVTLPALMPKFLKITTQATPIDKLMRTDNLIVDDPRASFVDLTFTLERDAAKSATWWNVAESLNKMLSFLESVDGVARNTSDSKSLIIFTFNDKMFPPGVLSWISGKGIVGLYTTFVIVVGWSMKSSLTNTSSKTMFEDMPYVDRILQLCLDIFLVRERGEFGLEEDLFAKLLFLYRSPETLIKWTRPPEDGGSDEY